jgi:hypothetical protein
MEKSENLKIPRKKIRHSQPRENPVDNLWTSFKL